MTFLYIITTVYLFLILMAHAVREGYTWKYVKTDAPYSWNPFVRMNAEVDGRPDYHTWRNFEYAMIAVFVLLFKSLPWVNAVPLMIIGFLLGMILVYLPVYNKIKYDKYLYDRSKTNPYVIHFKEYAYPSWGKLYIIACFLSILWLGFMP
jgi:hypothetical protein